jgi:uncharacterized protein (TIGR02246 family)
MKKTLVATLVFAVMLPALSAFAAGKEKDEDAIKARVAEFVAVFNKGDAKAATAFFADDATLVNPIGKSGKGSAEIEKVITEDLATILKGTTSEMKVANYRAVGKDAAFVDLEQTVTGVKAPDGKPLPPVTFHVPALLIKKGKVWLIAEARPYAYLPPPPPPPAFKK